MIWFQFILATLASWRITSLLVQEDGPFDLFGKLRNLVGVQYDEYGRSYGENVLSRLFSCVWCMGVWVSLVVVLFLDVTNWKLFLLYWLAISAGVILVDSLARRE